MLNVFLTGATGGIGAALAHEFAARAPRSVSSGATHKSFRNSSNPSPAIRRAITRSWRTSRIGTT